MVSLISDPSVQLIGCVVLKTNPRLRGCFLRNGRMPAEPVVPRIHSATASTVEFNLIWVTAAVLQWQEYTQRLLLRTFWTKGKLLFTPCKTLQQAGWVIYLCLGQQRHLAKNLLEQMLHKGLWALCYFAWPCRTIAVITGLREQRWSKGWYRSYSGSHAVQAA